MGGILIDIDSEGESGLGSTNPMGGSGSGDAGGEGENKQPGKQEGDGDKEGGEQGQGKGSKGEQGEGQQGVVSRTAMMAQGSRSRKRALLLKSFLPLQNENGQDILEISDG